MPRGGFREVRIRDIVRHLGGEEGILRRAQQRARVRNISVPDAVWHVVTAANESLVRQYFRQGYDDVADVDMTALSDWVDNRQWPSDAAPSGPAGGGGGGAAGGR